MGSVFSWLLAYKYSAYKKKLSATEEGQNFPPMRVKSHKEELFCLFRGGKFIFWGTVGLPGDIDPRIFSEYKGHNKSNPFPDNVTS